MFLPNEEKENITKDIYALDGKICCSSRRINSKNSEIFPVNVMTTFNATKDLPIATKFIDEKTNEIPPGPKLIKLLDLTSTISTFDALNTQSKTIEVIAKND